MRAPNVIRNVYFLSSAALCFTILFLKNRPQKRFEVEKFDVKLQWFVIGIKSVTQKRTRNSNLGEMMMVCVRMHDCSAGEQRGPHWYASNRFLEKGNLIEFHHMNLRNELINQTRDERTVAFGVVFQTEIFSSIMFQNLELPIPYYFVFNHFSLHFWVFYFHKSLKRCAVVRSTDKNRLNYAFCVVGLFVIVCRCPFTRTVIYD